MTGAYDSLKFMHANLAREVRLIRGQIVGYHYSEAHKATAIYTAGGAIFPVKQTLDEVEVIINSAAKEPTKER